MTARRKTFRVSLLFFFLFILVLSGVKGAEPAKPKSITYLNMGALSGDPGIARAIEAWEKKTGIKVNVLEMAFPPIYDKIVTVLSTGDPSIDVIAGSDFWTIDFAAAGWLEPLKGKAIEEAIAQYPKDIQATCIYKGKIYGAPGGNMLQVFYYRTDLLKEAGLTRPPKTWEEVIEVGKKLTVDKDGDGNVDQWGIVHAGLPEWEFGHFVQTLAHQLNGGLFDKQGRVTVNGPAMVKALQTICDFRNKYKISPPGVNTYGSGDVLMAFKSGKAAMAVTTTFMIKELDAPGSAIKGKWAISILPTFEGGRESTTYITTPLNLNKASKNKYWAMDFISFYASAKGQIEEMIYEPGNVALMPNAYDHPLVKNPPSDALAAFNLTLEKWTEIMKVLRDSSKIAEVEHYINQDQIDRMWWTEINNALSGNTTPKETLDHAAARILAFIKSRGK